MFQALSAHHQESQIVLIQHLVCFTLCRWLPGMPVCCHNTALLITMYFYWLFVQKCNFSQAQCKLPEDGPNGLKHVGANIRYFDVNFNISYV